MNNSKNSYRELKVGKITTNTNVVIALIALIPALLCLLFTADAFFPTESPGTDSFPDPAADLETKILFSIASLLLLVFYRYVFINPFYNGNQLILHKRLNYFLQVVIINVLTLALFIYFMKDQFIPLHLDTNAEGTPYLYLFLYLPFVPLTMATIGCYYNLKQKYSDTSEQIISYEK